MRPSGPTKDPLEDLVKVILGSRVLEFAKSRSRDGRIDGKLIEDDLFEDV
jgi:hypothetical protein